MQQRLLMVALAVLLGSCGPQLPTTDEADLRFATIASPLPDNLRYQEIGFARELINIKSMLVVISGGSNPIPLDRWDDFKPRLPWTKNLDRNLLFDSTAFYRSPGVPTDCQGDDCFTFTDYKDYTWLALAQPIAVAFVPEGIETDLLKPDPGTLVIKTIEKCQTVLFRDSIYRLGDGQGNFYAMHATETGSPDLNVSLPAGWTLEVVALPAPLVITPFGGGDHCYYNILGDHLGQGYHQYVFADSVYPAD
ncbi:MAG: hypothetical protein OHK0039_33420 [Bacteroidia bacterium]